MDQAVVEKILQEVDRSGSERRSIYQWGDSRLLLKIGDDCALKMYKDKFKCNEADSMRIARNIGGVRCPRVIASGMIEGHTYILMEWIDGTNLGDVWENLTGENKQV
ncbi:hypothetical protein EV179_006589, partial [Coemansia sp. RSA 487]